MAQTVMMDRVMEMFPVFRLWALRFRMIPLKREWMEALLEMGEAVYDLFRQGKQEIGKAEFQEKYQRLLSLEEEMEDLREEILLLQGQKPRKRCPSCGKYIAEDSKYCSYCGVEQKK